LKPRPAGRAADHFWGLLVTHEGDRDPDADASHRGDSRDDHEARQAVVEYERLRGRRAEAMSDNQAGYDVVSEEPNSGRRRRIEVKGVQGRFEGDASVVLTARQAHDAVRNDDDGVEYWLYVVDSTESSRPRVFPIPWARRRTQLRYGFYACVWSAAADQPAVVTPGGLEELTLSAMAPLDPGDLGDEWDDANAEDSEEGD
jgi:hypothetical protein